jgi:hypothetical protein
LYGESEKKNWSRDDLPALQIPDPDDFFLNVKSISNAKYFNPGAMTPEKSSKKYFLFDRYIPVLKVYF